MEVSLVYREMSKKKGWNFLLLEIFFFYASRYYRYNVPVTSLKQRYR